MHSTLLLDIAIALVVAFIGGLIARRLGLSTIVGYLLGGIVIGPFTPGFVGSTENISQLAELGVIFLMFGVGLHFSLKDLWKVRAIAIPGAIGQMTLATLLGFALSQLWGWTVPAGIVLGLAISIASTVVLLRNLMDNGLLNTPHGQAAVGWLVLQDLATVLILVFMPALANTSGPFDWQQLGLTLLKAGLFIALVFFAGTRFIPWLLLHIAHTRSRELFILSVLAVSLGTALGATEFFGVSLALGAFVAGVVVSESPLSHQVGADLVPFREAFAVLFFVSIGMLVNPAYLLANIGPVLALTALIMIANPLITFTMGIIFPWHARTTLVIAVGLSQIGEFSFILGQAGITLGMINHDQYSLILAGALLSITLNPFMFRLLTPLEKNLKRIPALWKLLDRSIPLVSIDEAHLAEHVVIVGYGRVGRHIANLLAHMNIPFLVVDADSTRIEELMKAGTLALYGDAANSEVLAHAGLTHARALVVAGPDESSSELVVAAARDLAPQLPIIARAATTEGVKHLNSLGAQHVIHPELEGGLEIVRYTLLQLGFPLHGFYRYKDAVRHDNYDLEINTESERRILQELIDEMNRIEIIWLQIPAGSPIVGQTLETANLRVRTGASVIAIIRNGQALPNPKSLTIFEHGDRVGFIGEDSQIEAVQALFAAPQVDDNPTHP